MSHGPPAERAPAETAGHYARKQIHRSSRLIAWTHRRRFETALSLARDLGGKRVLDYGCGDGTFLELLMRGERPPAAALGVEIHQTLVADCRERLGATPGLGFALTGELDTPEQRGAWDAIFCMEVLEHVVEVEPVLDRLARLLAPAGRLVVSVPVETGLPLVAKQLARRVAGWRGLGDYPGQTPYRPAEMARAVFAGRRTAVARAPHVGIDGHPAYDHKGFNWMALRRRLAERFRLERTSSSPIRWLPPHLGSQAWFVASPR
jgi:2-polyprenyl-3-methyl-5-hydroxy-6-metoxy-1,4-benzoquinol methylase